MSISHIDKLTLDRYGYQPDYDASWHAEPVLVALLAVALTNPSTRRILDLGVGTGRCLLQLATRGFRLIGFERSAELLEQGRARVRQEWIRADALALPLRDKSIDSVIGLHASSGLENSEASLRELRRVVRNGVVLQTVVRENIETLWYRHYFPEIDALLIPRHLPLGTIIVSMLRAGFRRVVSRPAFYSNDADLKLESAREHPTLLFDASFRKATSVFNKLSHQSLESGLKALDRDLSSGALTDITLRYETEHASAGDCVVLCACAF